MGVAFPSGRPLNTKTFTWVDLEPAIQGESDKQFSDINTIFRFRSYFLMRVFGSGRLQLLPQPSPRAGNRRQCKKPCFWRLSGRNHPTERGHARLLGKISSNRLHPAAK